MAVAPAPRVAISIRPNRAPNLTIRTHAMTDHIIFDGKRAVGVEWLEGDSTIPTRATANKEVLLCAGAIASPQILQRSGVGSAELLAEFDIPLVHDLPGVGENLQDHWRCTCNMSAKNRFPSTLPCSGGISRKSVRVAVWRHRRWCQQPL